MPTLNVNNKEVIKHTARLEKLHRSAFPSAVRGTLNTMAFNDKQMIPKVAKKKFITRSPNFFKAFTTVQKAQGWSVNKMHSITGINANKGSKVAKGLEAQEHGGTLKGRKLLTHQDSRVSKNRNKKVSTRARFDRRGGMHDATRALKSHNGSRSSKFVAAVMSTAKAGKTDMLLRSKTNRNGIVYEVKNVSQNIKTRKVKFRIKKLYTYRDNPNTKVAPTRFMSDSAKIIHKQVYNIYKKEAEFQFKKALKR